MNRDAFHAAIDMMVALNDERNYSIDREAMGSLVYAREFGTVRVNLGRGFGHSEYIKRHVTPRDVVVVRNWNSAKLYNQLTKVVPGTALVDSANLFGLYVDTVYIDNPSAVFEQVPKDDVYRELLKYGAKRFILLGA